MATCPKCGSTVNIGERFCRTCGIRIDAAHTAAAPGGDAEKDLAVFIGKNSEKYLSRFRRFTAGGQDSFNVTWHWPAFFFSFWWMLYRKMYLWALLALFLGCVPYLGLVAMVAFGICGNYLYYRHAKGRVAEIRSAPGSDVEIAAALARAGGVNNVAVVVAPLILIAVIAILAAVAIPQFALYRQKAYEQKARQQLTEACSLGAEFFANHPERTQIEPEDLLAAGLVHTEDVEMLLLDGSRERFSISARHVKGKKTFTTDPTCRVSVKEQGTGRQM